MATKKIPSNDFYRRVYQMVKKIPRGRVTTYGAIAERLGARSSSRTVGYALRVCSDLRIPCHRVVNRLGELTGAHAFGARDLMKDILLAEGVTFRKEAVIMEKHFWKPK